MDILRELFFHGEDGTCLLDLWCSNWFREKSIFLFIYFCCARSLWLRRLSLVAVSGDYSLVWRLGFSCEIQAPGYSGFSSCSTWAQYLRLPGSRAWLQALEHGSEVVIHGLSCSEVCGIFPPQGSNPCHLHWQLDSLPTSHQGSPIYF